MIDETKARDLAAKLRAAAKRSLVEELPADDLRTKNWLQGAGKPVVVGTFRFATPTPFFVQIFANARGGAGFNVAICRTIGQTIMDLREGTTTGLEWTYRPAKRDARNGERKVAFVKRAGSDTVPIPLPDGDVVGFAEAIARALSIRDEVEQRLGGDDDDDDNVGDDAETPLDVLQRWYPDENDLRTLAAAMAGSIRVADAGNRRSWVVNYRKDREVVRLNVGFARVFDIRRGDVLVAISTEKLPATRLKALDELVDEEGGSLSEQKYGRNVALRLSPAQLRALDEDVKAAHTELVVRCSAHGTTPFAKFHKPGVLHALRALSGEDIPDPTLSVIKKNSFWKVSPGEHGSEWAQCRDGGYVAIGWTELGDLQNVDEAEFDRRASAARAKHGWGTGGPLQVWKFRNINLGDRIVANAGTSRVLGIGTVVERYYFVDGTEFGHRLGVRWDDVTERVVDEYGWRSTVIRLTEEAFDEITRAPAADAEEAAPVPAVAQPSGGIDFEGIISRLESRSLSFPAELIAAYLLALQARRFVLLTGISGTGKTQLALEVARLFAPAASSARHTPDNDRVVMTVKPYMLKYGRFVLPVKLAQDFDVLYDDKKRLDVRMLGRSAPESMALVKRGEGGTLLYVLLSGETRREFMQNVVEGTQLVVRREENEGKEVLVVERANEDVAAPTIVSHQLVAVRPDWTDGRALLGFYNPLTRTYASTPTLNLVIRAAEEARLAVAEARPPRPFFLIFDEMNLARVEQYFSDFLSAMESGEHIDLHDDDEIEDVPSRVALPPNLFVVGTVNVDETTYMFSPKVLDRAFVLEFNEVDLDLLSGRGPKEEPDSTPLALTKLSGGLKLIGRQTDAEWTAFEQHRGGELRRLLDAVHQVLVDENRHFGYRVAREIARFTNLASEQTNGGHDSLLAAFDVALLAKVLPKLGGTQADLEHVLDRLLLIAFGEALSETKALDGCRLARGRLSAAGGEEPLLPRTAAKLWRMRRRLGVQGFVSFIE